MISSGITLSFQMSIAPAVKCARDQRLLSILLLSGPLRRGSSHTYRARLHDQFSYWEPAPIRVKCEPTHRSQNSEIIKAVRSLKLCAGRD